MTKETVFTIIRAVGNLLGAYLLGKTIFGTALDAAAWEGIVGGVIVLVATIWGIADKTAGVEKLQSALRSLQPIVSGILVGAGVIKPEQFEAIVLFISTLIPIIQSETARKKAAGIKSGAIPVSLLKTSKKAA